MDNKNIDNLIEDINSKPPKDKSKDIGIIPRYMNRLYNGAMAFTAIIIVSVGISWAYDQISHIGEPPSELNYVKVEKRWLQIDRNTMGDGMSFTDVKTPSMKVNNYDGVLCGNKVTRIKEGDVLKFVKFRPEKEFYGNCHEVVSYEKASTSTTK